MFWDPGLRDFVFSWQVLEVWSTANVLSHICGEKLESKTLSESNIGWFGVKEMEASKNIRKKYSLILSVAHLELRGFNKVVRYKTIKYTEKKLRNAQSV